MIMKLVEINDLYFRTWENPNHGLATTGLAGIWARGSNPSGRAKLLMITASHSYIHEMEYSLLSKIF
jgi:hypothetical protein